jgi:hypothetical protein
LAFRSDLKATALWTRLKAAIARFSLASAAHENALTVAIEIINDDARRLLVAVSGKSYRTEPAGVFSDRLKGENVA